MLLAVLAETNPALTHEGAANTDLLSTDQEINHARNSIDAHAQDLEASDILLLILNELA
jgi:hypothetical protein